MAAKSDVMLERMRITVGKDAKCGDVFIPKGDYWVTLQSDTQQLLLASGGKDIKIPATRRRTKAKTRVTTVTFFSVGGPVWSLVVSTPQYGEYVAFVEVDVVKEDKDDDRRRRR
jgi:hypothetical protein